MLCGRMTGKVEIIDPLEMTYIPDRRASEPVSDLHSPNWAHWDAMLPVSAPD